MRAYALSLLLLLSSCGDAVYELVDESDIELGAIYTSKEELILIGWTGSDHTVEAPIFYGIAPKPGALNRFVTSRHRMPVGLRIAIVEAQRCTNCTFGLQERPRYKVSIVDYKLEYPVPVYVGQQTFLDNFVASDT